MHAHTDERFCELGRAVINTEAKAVTDLAQRINHQFAQACRVLLSCQGRIVVLGMGKSGHIGRKIAATLASTGSPSFFVHPGEASHGDLGMITPKDVVLAISNSGETTEILDILPLIKRLEVPFIALTGNTKSTLAQFATIHLDISVAQEACPLGLAPTSSTTATLAMGDALAVALLEARGFTAEDFALTHPKGALGLRLLLRVESAMRTGDAIPKVNIDTPLNEVLIEMSKKSLGMTTVIDNHGKLLGIFTDGDLRRTLDHNPAAYPHTPVNKVMSTHCKTIDAQALAIDALNLMESHKITVLLILDKNNIVTGVVHMHDLLRAGVA